MNSRCLLIHDIVGRDGVVDSGGVWGSDDELCEFGEREAGTMSMSMNYDLTFMLLLQIFGARGT